MRSGFVRATAIVIVLCALRATTVFGQPVASCEGVADGTPCDDGDGCSGNDGFDHCAAGVCAGPGPCKSTTFSALPGGRIRMEWTAAAVELPGTFCEGVGLIPADQASAALGVSFGVLGEPMRLLPVTRATRQSRREVPPPNRKGALPRVVLQLKLNRLGRLLLASGRPLAVTSRMTLQRPDKPAVSANKLLELLRRGR